MYLNLIIYLVDRDSDAINRKVGTALGKFRTVELSLLRYAPFSQIDSRRKEERLFLNCVKMRQTRPLFLKVVGSLEMMPTSASGAAVRARGRCSRCSRGATRDDGAYPGMLVWYMHVVWDDDGKQATRVVKEQRIGGINCRFQDVALLYWAQKSWHII